MIGCDAIGNVGGIPPTQGTTTMDRQMNQHETQKAMALLNQNHIFVGLSADWIDECWALGHSNRIGTFIRLAYDNENAVYFELVERSICLDTGEYHAEQLDTFIEGESQRLMEYIDSRIANKPRFSINGKPIESPNVLLHQAIGHIVDVYGGDQ